MSGLVPLVATWNCLLQKWVFRPVGPSLAASLEPLAHRGNVGKVFSILITLDVTGLSMSTVFFPCTAKLWNPLHIECFALTYNLNGCKSTINRHLLTAVFY